MATTIHRLTALQVLQAKADCDDGGGLVLRIKPSGAAWTWRFTAPDGRRREMGLGTCQRKSQRTAGESLERVRTLVSEARGTLARGVDPLAERQRARAGARAELAREKTEAKATREVEHWTLARCARDYHARAVEPKKSLKHAAQWIASLENHVPSALWNAPVDAIEAPALLAALLDVAPHERARNLRGDKLPETVQRIRQRLDAIFEDAIFHKLATVNPAAAVKRKLREATGRRVRGQLRALPYAEAPLLMRELRAAPGVAARCLEFAVLTAARTSEALLAEWSEFDLANSTWVCPAGRMKAKEPHTVYLSTRAVELLRAQQGQDTRLVFPSPASMDAAPGQRQPLSNMAMLTTLGRIGYRDRTTVHGLARATFSTWANETGTGRPDVIEACLAHEEGNRVRAAYLRSKFNEERRTLLAAWAEYLQREPAQVIDLESKRA